MNWDRQRAGFSKGSVQPGREYFFGGGIQSEDPQIFRQSKGLYPFETIAIGTTIVSKESFDTWCQSMMRTGRFSPDAYDLLTRNCNNFCHEALSFLGIDESRFPKWILEVPQRFLSSPMGQMVRPMLENMQITAPMGRTTYIADPTIGSSVQNPWVPTTTTAPAVSKNPWGKPTTTTTTPIGKETVSCLDSLTQPLLSGETRTVRTCVGKIINSIPENGGAKSLLERFATDIVECKTKTIRYQQELCNIISMLLENQIQPTFTLMLARIVVLHCQSTSQILEWIHNNESGCLSGNARAMAWLVVGNIIAHQKQVDDWVLDKAMAAMSDPQVAVRQAVAAVLYNSSLILANDVEQLEDSTVSVLCILLEDEEDDTTRERRWMAAGKWLKTNAAARHLARELNIADRLEREKSQIAQEIRSLLTH